MDDVDSPEKLAELEALLYSQIHFSTDRNDDAVFGTACCTPTPPTTTSFAVSPHRYYAAASRRMHRNDHRRMDPRTMGPQIMQPPILQMMQLPQTMGIVVVPPSPETHLTKRQRRSLRRNLLRDALTNAELFRTLNKADRTAVLRMDKRGMRNVRRSERLRLKQQKLQQQQQQNEYVKYTPPSRIMDCNTVIEISDSNNDDDDDDVVAIEPDIDLVELSSGDEEDVKPFAEISRKIEFDRESDLDDCVEYVDIPATEPINVDDDDDEERQSRNDAELMKPPSDQRSNMIFTPESSNDFLDHTFNVSEHSTEAAAHFRRSDEMCDSESSVSEPVFNEIDFECAPQEQLFVEDNFDTFMNFITPKRNNAPCTSSPLRPHLRQDRFEQVPTRASHPNNNSDSGSSSESEYEHTTRQRLPSLCEFAPNEEEERTVSSLEQIESRSVNFRHKTQEEEERSSEGLTKKKTKKKKAKRSSEDERSDAEMVQHSSKRKSMKKVEKSVLKKRRMSQLDSSTSSSSSSSSDVVFLPQDISCVTLSSDDDDDDDDDDDTSTLQSSNTTHTSATSDFPETTATDENVFENTVTSWCDPHFDYDRVLQSLPSDPERWQILRIDALGMGKSPRRPRCKICHEVGHIARNCNRVAFKCWMCGGGDHLEPECPHAVCTNCQRRTRFLTTSCGKCANVPHVTCTNCGYMGHSEDMCPDQWRRYHLTTMVGELRRADVKLKAGDDRWCSGCGRRGHFEFTCNLYSRQYLPCSLEIFNYTDLYAITPSSGSDASSPSKCRTANDNRRAGGKTRYKKSAVSIRLNAALNRMLHAPKAVHILNELVQDLYCTYEFATKDTGTEIIFRGHPLDLMKVRKLFATLVKDHTVNARKISLSNREYKMMSSAIGREFTTLLSKQFNVSHAIEVTNSSKVLHAYCDAITLVLVEHRVRSFLDLSLASSRNSSTPTTHRSPIPPPTNTNVEPPVRLSPNAKTYKLPKYVRRMLSKETNMKEFVNKTCDEHAVTWKVVDDNLLLDGTPEGIQNVVSRIGDDLDTDNCVPCFNITKRIADLIADAKTANSTSLDALLKKRDYSKLNLVLFCEHDFYQGKQILANLEHLVDTIRDKLVMSKFVYEKARTCVQFMRSMRHHSFYVDCVKKVRDREMEAIPVTEILPSSECPDPQQRIILQPSHILHLIETEAGLDFLEELQAEVSLEVNQNESALLLTCSRAQKEKIANKVEFYFKLLSYEFPRTASEIYQDLKKRLTIVHLDYYELNCQELYDEVFGDGKPENHVALLAKLHGLLFAKYEFLQGAEHVDTLHDYMPYLRNKGDRILSYAHFRRMKTSAMYLFCPFVMNINYALLVKLAVRPQLLVTLQSGAVNDLKRKLEAARRIYALEDHSGLLMSSLNLIQRFVNNAKFANNSMRICYAFLHEHFPITFATNAPT